MKRTVPVKLRVAQVISSTGWGGRERVPLLLARELAARGHAASIWADPAAKAGGEALGMGTPFRPFRFRSYLSPAGIQEARRALALDQPDVVHLHEGKDLWAVVPALALSGFKGLLVLSQHVGNARPKKDLLHGRLYGRVDLVLACSEAIRKNALSTLPVPGGACLTAYAPVDLGAFRFSSKARIQYRKKWKLPKNPVIGMVARLTPGKGHELVMEMAAVLAKKMPSARFKLAGGAASGEEDYASDLRRRAAGMGLEGILGFEGYLPDVPGFLSAVDLVVHPARAEAFGMAVVEALAVGRPVLALDREGSAEILRGRDGKVRGGRLLPGEDPEAWAEEAARILKSRAQQGVLSRQARPLAGRFSLETFVDNHLAWYGEFLDRRKIFLATDAHR